MSKADASLVDYRPPITVVVGHVDVGKTLLLDKIRGTFVAYREPGMITQHIGLSFIPWGAVEKIADPLLAKFKLKGRVWIRGFLMVDTPGHAAFSNLRRRGGSVADLAVLVIDITRGFEEQTYESLTLIRSRNIPFVVAANKLDRIYGWEPNENAPFLESYDKQREDVQGRVEEAIARIIEEFNKLGMDADRYDRVRDFNAQVPIVPTSAVTGEGLADLLVVLAGLSQRFNREKLRVTYGPGKGVVMEIREEKGWGVTGDVVLYDGVIRKGDVVVTAGLEGPVSTRVKMLVLPKPLNEMRDPEDRYMFMDEVRAAVGVKIIADGLDQVVPGAPIFVVPQGASLDEYMKLVKEEVSEVRIETDKEGVVAKADTLGTLEAMVIYLRSQGIPVRKADVGNVSRRDVVEASIVKKKNPLYGVILAFNVKVPHDIEIEAMQYGVRIFRNEILYRLVEEFTQWYKEQKTKLIEMELDKYIRPGKIRILPGYVFRRSNPVIVGVAVLEGVIKPGYTLMRGDGKKVGTIMQIQDKGKNIQEARKGMEVAISIEGNVMIGRQIKEGDELYIDVPEEHAITLMTQFKDQLTEDEMALLKEILRIKRSSK
ncbi:translation initiation factor IF-2 [Vulcanisaeta souniana]|uniref:Probable translation initiation factor IF-2 n=1 Tax=Vulcanisaeta souniana JCM 11219 TaxID=1293586 RepID=A0A830EBQ9_9CREN|nr:translation initiation factor IF-2 [Vulcanisaeta souniana]BDR92984.1 translation initiation factor IF-2 [Vulcanisaeta souniana JCM 11219]GGI83788.1 translation initiation factor IF-2 [Vulcanisaeta souniana JCM 11219]